VDRGKTDRPTTGTDHFRHEVLAVVFQVRRGELCTLLWQRARPPFGGQWALPGGPLGAEERLGASLARHLRAKVALSDVGHLEQLETRSDVDRDPREREIATAYLALVSTESEPPLPLDTAWHPVNDLPPCAFDHASIIDSARERLRAKLTYTNIGFAMAPPTFTLGELRAIYAAGLGHPMTATNLQRVLCRRRIIEATGEFAASSAAGGRPANRYRFVTRVLEVTDPFAVLRPPAPARRPG
jgi:ADP-ribose pyrophosphatase YjhB (NUDIX family)